MSNLVITGSSFGPCKCCVGEGHHSISCRSKGGLIEMCGFDELADASVPPKKYLQMTFAGTLTGLVYNGQGALCTVNDGGNFTITYSGTAIFDDEDDCSFSTTGNSAVSVNGGSPSNIPLSGDPGFTTNCNEDVARTTTDGSLTGNAACCASGPSSNQRHTGSLSWTLSNEQTEQDAINLVIDGQDWSDYGQDCVSIYQIRTGFSFIYALAQFQVLVTLLTPSAEYTVTVRIYRSISGHSIYSLFQTMEFDRTADLSGNIEISDVDIPNDRGFDFIAAGVYVALA